ncbi:MAG: hypothetical protein NUV56_00750 [Candidatus Uhrbacteria bacterium]|nr:hypothetical protein [Candidatus Uhrbacteria bacterium]
MNVELHESNRIVVTEHPVHDEFEDNVRYLAKEGWELGGRLRPMPANKLRDSLKQYVAQIGVQSGGHQHIAHALEGVFLSAACQRAIAEERPHSPDDESVRSILLSYVVISQQSLARALLSLPFTARMRLWRGATINQRMFWGMAGAYGVATVARELSTSVDVYLASMVMDRSWGTDLICPVTKREGYCVQVKCGNQTRVDLAVSSGSDTFQTMRLLRTSAYHLNRATSHRGSTRAWRPALVTVKMAGLPTREGIVNSVELNKLVEAVKNFS